MIQNKSCKEMFSSLFWFIAFLWSSILLSFVIYKNVLHSLTVFSDVDISASELLELFPSKVYSLVYSFLHLCLVVVVLTRTCLSPEIHLFSLHVLQPALMKHNPYNCPYIFPSVSPNIFNFTSYD